MEEEEKEVLENAGEGKVFVKEGAAAPGLERRRSCRVTIEGYDDDDDEGEEAVLDSGKAGDMGRDKSFMLLLLLEVLWNGDAYGPE